MRYTSFFVALVIAAIFTAQAQAQQIVLYTHPDVTISSTVPTLVHGISPGRRWSLLINTGAYSVRVATSALISVTSGVFVSNGGGYIEDEFYVVTSSWYAISTGTDTTTISYSEKR